MPSTCTQSRTPIESRIYPVVAPNNPPQVPYNVCVAAAQMNQLQTIGAATNAANAMTASSFKGLVRGFLGKATLVFAMGGNLPLASGAAMSIIATQAYNTFAQVPAVASAIYNSSQQFKADVKKCGHP
jgi:hypothetical protein